MGTRKDRLDRLILANITRIVDVDLAGATQALYEVISDLDFVPQVPSDVKTNFFDDGSERDPRWLLRR